jgi:hypothetical protein
MKLTSVVVMAALAAVDARGGQADTNPARMVTVYVWGEQNLPPLALAGGLAMAADMFAEIGVTVEWRHRRPADGQAQAEHAIAIAISGGQGGSTTESVASASPYEGSTITIFYGAMRWADQNRHLARTLLAHVLVHEITHNLQAVARHSATGVMKERWTVNDYKTMEWKPLSFEPIDVELILKGLAYRRASYRRDS